MPVSTASRRGRPDLGLKLLAVPAPLRVEHHKNLLPSRRQLAEERLQQQRHPSGYEHARIDMAAQTRGVRGHDPMCAGQHLVDHARRISANGQRNTMRTSARARNITHAIIVTSNKEGNVHSNVTDRTTTMPRFRHRPNDQREPRTSVRWTTSFASGTSDQGWSCVGARRNAVIDLTVMSRSYSLRGLPSL